MNQADDSNSHCCGTLPCHTPLKISRQDRTVCVSQYIGQQTVSDLCWKLKDGSHVAGKGMQTIGQCNDVERSRALELGRLSFLG